MADEIFSASRRGVAAISLQAAEVVVHSLARCTVVGEQSLVLVVWVLLAETVAGIPFADGSIAAIAIADTALIRTSTVSK